MRFFSTCWYNSTPCLFFFSFFSFLFFASDLSLSYNVTPLLARFPLLLVYNFTPLFQCSLIEMLLCQYPHLKSAFHFTHLHCIHWANCPLALLLLSRTSSIAWTDVVRSNTWPAVSKSFLNTKSSFVLNKKALAVTLPLCLKRQMQSQENWTGGMVPTPSEVGKIQWITSFQAFPLASCEKPWLQEALARGSWNWVLCCAGAHSPQCSAVQMQALKQTCQWPWLWPTL